jgi:hypothetical protein
MKKYSIDSLYDVMKNPLSNLLMDIFLEKRGEIVIELAFEIEPFDNKGDINSKFGEFIVDMAAALNVFGIIKPEFVDQMLLAQDMAFKFSYDHMRARDVDFILKVKQYKEAG